LVKTAFDLYIGSGLWKFYFPLHELVTTLDIRENKFKSEKPINEELPPSLIFLFLYLCLKTRKKSAE